MPEISSADAAAMLAGIAPLQLQGDHQLVMRVMPMPADANGNGDIFGGWIMAQVRSEEHTSELQIGRASCRERV